MMDKRENRMPVVSIVVPVYNSAPFLPACLDSILGQTYRELELLCVDDGSTDRSLEILKEYAEKDPRIHVFTKRNEGKGAASARNLGMDHASGRYILFLDSDDFFAPSMIEELTAKADEMDAEVVICRASWFDNNLHRTTKSYAAIELDHAPSRIPFSFRDCPDHIFQIGDLIVWNKLYRLDFLREYGLRFEAIPISDDQYVPALALVFAKRIAYVNKSFVNYRFNTGTSQVDTQPRHPEAAYAATYSIVKRMRKAGIYGTVKRSYVNMAIRLMREYFDKMLEYRALRFLYDAYRSEIFSMLGAEDLPEGYFYDPRVEEWYRMVRDCPLEEILFQTARGYGDEMTTAILRFQVPYGEIPKGSRIALVGPGIIVRHWHAQLLLSDWCTVVACAGREEELPAGLEYDSIVRAR